MRRPCFERLAAPGVVVALACALAGCGGAMPLGHPAHALSRGKVNVGAGVAGTFTLDAPRPTSVPTARLRELAIAPDVSPWVSARAGFGSGFEGGLGVSARALRVDGRHAFLFPNAHWAFSIGMGASAIVAAMPSDAASTARASGVLGGGFDVPLLFGWRSRADLYSFWAGPRVGAELVSGQVEGGTGGRLSASGRSLSFGGVVGLRAGLRHLFAVVELDGAYHLATGTIGAASVAAGGFTLTPFGGLVVSF